MNKKPQAACWLVMALAGLLLLAACTASGGPLPGSPAVTDPPSADVQLETTSSPTVPADPLTPADPPQPDYEIVTLLPPDAIPSIDDPQFQDLLGAQLEYDPEEMVLGVERNGDARAYPIEVLARHEIVNDTVGGEPLAVTY